ncbi:MAG: hypothetical protein IPO67_01270 [Deltaproteobacteria bacterium]|nr:hypothetical protein [Deltaproteobacteria bacterium]
MRWPALQSPAIKNLGGPWALVAIFGLQLFTFLLFMIEPVLAAALAAGLAAAGAVLVSPLAGVALLIAARLFTTGAIVFTYIGGFGIGPYELVLVLCALAVVVRASLDRLPLNIQFPWRAPFLALFSWICLSLTWSVSRSEGIKDILPLVMVMANVGAILAFVRTWRDFLWMVRAWLITCVGIGLVTILIDQLGITVGVSFKAAESGGRETGLGQQPNWFAMNLFFVIPAAFGLALVERQLWARLAAVVGGLFVMFSMLGAGSRGGAYATVIGVALTALGHPTLRRYLVGIGGVSAVGVAAAAILDIGGIGRALGRIALGVSLEQNYRPWNWAACVQMFTDTYGRGIGVGGYETLLPDYNYLLSQSLYTYPHGIFWEVIAHYGIVGLGLVTWLVFVVIKMSADTIRLARGTEAVVFAWAFPASMLGYVAWSFVEFTLAEKPFWEWLALYTALTLALQRGERPPAWGAKAAVTGAMVAPPSTQSPLP